MKEAILQIVPSLNSGGVERGAVDIARAIVAHGWNSYVVSSGGRLVSQLEEEGSKHIPLPVNSKNPWTIYRNAKALAAIINECNISVVHVRSRAPAWSARLAAKWCKVPLLTTFHGTYGASNCFKRWYNSAMVRGQKIIAVSEFISQHVQHVYGVSKDKIVMIHRGTDMEYFSPKCVTKNEVKRLREELNLKDERPVFFVPGRFTRWKGQDVVLQALAGMEKNSCYCVFAGDRTKHPRFVEELEDYIAVHVLEDMVRSVDVIEDVRVAYAMADAVIAPSIEPEAFGRVPVEAAAMQRPVIVSDIGGFQETVIAEETGYVVKAGDVVAHQQSMENLLKQPREAREKMGHAAREHVEKHFALSHMQEQTLAVYQSLMNRR